MTRALIAAVLLALLAAAWQWREATAAEARAETAEGQRDAFSKALDESTKARAEESRRTKRMQENQDAEFLARQAAQRDAAAARAALGGLRERAQALAATSCPARDPEAAPGGPSATDPARVLADVLGEVGEEARRYAEIADSARIAGQLCERAYDALTER